MDGSGGMPAPYLPQQLPQAAGPIAVNPQERFIPPGAYNMQPPAAPVAPIAAPPVPAVQPAPQAPAAQGQNPIVAALTAAYKDGKFGEDDGESIRTQLKDMYLNPYFMHGAPKQITDFKAQQFDHTFDQIKADLAKQLSGGQDPNASGGLLNNTKAFFKTGVSIVPDTLALGAGALGGLASLGGLAPNRVSDALFKYGADSRQQGLVNENGEDISPEQFAIHYAQSQQGAQYDPSTKLTQEFIQQGLKRAGDVSTSLGGFSDKLRTSAYKQGTVGAVGGDVVSMISALYGNEAALAKIPSMVKAAEAIAKMQEVNKVVSTGMKLRRALPAASITGAEFASRPARQNIEQGSDTSQVAAQYIVDTAMNTLWNLIPGHVKGGIVRRGLSGGALGIAESAVQQTIDKAINSKNPDPDITSPQALTQTAFQVALSILLGRAPPKVKAKIEAATTGTKVPPAAEAAAQAAAPADINAFHATGLADKDFNVLQKKVQGAVAGEISFKAQARGFGSPQDLYQAALNIASDGVAAAKGDWAALSQDQQHALVDIVAKDLNARRAKANQFADITPEAEGAKFKAARFAQPATATPAATPAGTPPEPEVPPAAAPTPAPAETPPASAEGTTAATPDGQEITPDQLRTIVNDIGKPAGETVSHTGQPDKTPIVQVLPPGEATKDVLKAGAKTGTKSVNPELAPILAKNETDRTIQEHVTLATKGGTHTPTSAKGVAIGKALEAKGVTPENFLGLTVPQAEGLLKSLEKPQVPPSKKTVVKKEEVPPKKDVLKKEAPKKAETPPKQQAPAPSPKPGQTTKTLSVLPNKQESSQVTTSSEGNSASKEKPPTQTSSKTKQESESQKTSQKSEAAPKSESNEAAVERIAPDLTDSEKKELTNAINMAEAGAPQEFHSLVKSHIEDENINPGQAKALRDIVAAHTTKAKEVADAARKAREAEIKAQNDKTSSTEGPKNDGVDYNSLIDERKDDVTHPDPVKDLGEDRLKTIATTARLNKIIKDWRAGKIKSIEVVGKLKDLWEQRTKQAAERNFRDAFKDRVRGYDRAVAAIHTALARGHTSQKAADLALWLLKQNPHLADTMAISFKTTKGAAGTYNPVTRVVSISKMFANATTMAHEIMHHAERFMPPELQQFIAKEWAKQVDSIRAKATAAGDTKMVDYLNAVMYNMAHGTKDSNTIAQHALAELGDGDNNYQLFNPSEYWAENASKILARRFARGDGLIAKLHNWIEGFVQHVAKALGFDSNSAVYKGLDEILKGEGFESKKMVREYASAHDPAELHYSFIHEAKKLFGKEDAEEGPKEVFNARGPETIGRAATGIADYVDSTRGLLEAMRNLAKAGGNLTHNIFHAGVLASGRVADTIEQDKQMGYEPFKRYVVANYHKWGSNAKEAFDNLNSFFVNRNAQERIYSRYLLNGKLLAGKALLRKSIIDDMLSGSKTPEAARKEIERLIGSHKGETLEEFAKKQIENYESIKEELARLKAIGVDENSVAEANKHLDLIRETTKTRRIESGDVSEDDPWIKFYDWKYYVSMKGKSKFANSKLANMDYEGTTGKIAMAAFNKQLTAAKGRKQVIDNAIQQTVQDMSMASKAAGQQPLMETLYHHIKDNLDFYHAKIRVWEGSIKDGYTLVSGNPKKGKAGLQTTRRALPVADKLNGFIYHDGDRHYVVTLPNSRVKDANGQDVNTNPIVRGLQGFHNERTPGMFTKIVAKPSNLWLRMLTVANPIWSTFTLFPRDAGLMPMMAAIRETNSLMEGAGIAANYFKNLIGNGGRITGFPGAFHVLMSGNKLKMDEFAKSDPDGYVAWARRLEKLGGGSGFTHTYGNERLTKELTGHYDAATGLWRVPQAVGKTWEAYNTFMGRYAQLLTNIGRVTIFKTLVKDYGMSETEAAAKTKDFLNYDQKGRSSRIMGTYIPFFRIAVATTDGMVRTFKKADGSFDHVKFAKWTPAFMAMGALGYTITKQLLGQDDKKKWNIDKYSLEDLTGGSILPIGDRAYSLKWQYGLPQMLLGSGVLAAAYADKMAGGSERDHGEIGRGYYELLARNGPVKPSGLPRDWGIGDAIWAWTGGVATSGVISPMRDIALNRSGFGSPIHTDHPKAGEFKSDQGKSSTPEEFKEMAQWIKKNTGYDAYPEDIAYALRSYGGSAASAFINATAKTNAMNLAGMPESALSRASGLEVSKSFYLSNKVYDTLDDLGDAVKTAAAIKQEALDKGMDESEANAARDEWIAAHPVQARQLEAYKALDSAMMQYHKDVNAIRKSGYAQEGREMRAKLAASKLRAALEAAQKSAPK